MHQIDINHAKGHLDDLLRSALNGEEIVITQDDQPVLKLVRINDAPKRRQSGSAKGQIWMSEDFDQPLDDFREYMG